MTASQRQRHCGMCRANLGSNLFKEVINGIDDWLSLVLTISRHGECYTPLVDGISGTHCFEAYTRRTGGNVLYPLPVQYPEVHAGKTQQYEIYQQVPIQDKALDCLFDTEP